MNILIMSLVPRPRKGRGPPVLDPQMSNDEDSGEDVAAHPPPPPRAPRSAAFGSARAAAAAVADPDAKDENADNIADDLIEPQSLEHSAESSPISLLRRVPKNNVRGKSPRATPRKTPRIPRSPPRSPRSPSPPATSSQTTTSSSQRSTSAATRRQLEEKLLLTPDQEQQLVDWFEAHPEFWDKENVGFKRKGKKDALLDDLAKDMELVGSQILTWFQSQRSMYGRLLKKTTGPSGTGLRLATAMQKWNLANFAFLRSHVAARTGSRQMGGWDLHLSTNPMCWRRRWPKRDARLLLLCWLPP